MVIRAEVLFEEEVEHIYLFSAFVTVSILYNVHIVFA
jgi:hypothetical protein